MSQNNNPGVAIVEDNSALGESLRKIIEASDSLSFAGLWTNGEDAVAEVESVAPDVLLMDINLPGMSGIEATALIKEKLPSTQIVMVTVYGDHDKIFAALKAGASGYLLKRSTPAEVREAIQEVLTGGAPMSAAIARRIVEAFHQPRDKSPEEESLSKREAEVLELLAGGLANKQIADRLDISTQTVCVHVKHIYEKLHVHSRVDAANWYRDTKGPQPRTP